VAQECLEVAAYVYWWVYCHVYCRILCMTKRGRDS
jgi:hypothetical protein